MSFDVVLRNKKTLTLLTSPSGRKYNLKEGIICKIETAEDLADAVEQVDALRREVASKANVNNPHIAESVDESEASHPQPSKLGKRMVKSPSEK